MSGRAARRKGHDYERELVRIYCDHGFAVSRNSNQAHPNAVDVDPKGDLLGLKAGRLAFHVQAKRQEKLNIWLALKQAEGDAPRGVIPTVHFRRARSGNYVALRLEDWLLILQQLRAEA